MKTYFTIFITLLSSIWCSAQTSYTVTDTADNGPGTLRSIIADSVSTGDTIFFDHAINGDTIFLTSGQMSINIELTIIGNGTDQTVIDGSKNLGNRIFDIITSTSGLYLSGVTISNAGGNSTQLFGGAIISNSLLHLDNCVFDGNQATLGGAIRINDGRLDMNACIFRNNKSDILGGAINSRGTSHRATNCLFHHNESQTTGGAIHNESAIWDLFNCTFADNDASSTGDGFQNAGSIDSLINCIFYDNNSEDFAGPFPGVVEHNLFQNFANTGATAGNDGNIDDNPNFSVMGDYRLIPSSPCIDKGQFVSQSTPNDLDGRSRLVRAMDMGPYEYPCPSDRSEIYANIEANGNDNGLEWSHAFTDLQDAIDLACDCATVTEIWVAQGTYFPTVPFDAGEYSGLVDREKTFYISKNIKLFGGFVGNETSRDSRDWDDNETILSGDLGVANDSLDNAYHVVWIDGTTVHGNIDSSTIFDGFNVTKGNGDISGVHSEGAGLHLNGSGTGNVCSPQIRNCTFQQNKAGRGGAIHANTSEGECSPLLSNCHFKQNEAISHGGAVFVNSYIGEWSPLFVNCSFTKNIAGERGGAIYTSDAFGGPKSSPKVLNCTFALNEASNAGPAIYYILGDTFFITNSIFWGNLPDTNPEISKGSSSVKLSHSILDDGHEDGNLILPDNVVDAGGNLDLDPMFMETMVGDLRLRTGSPAINQGDNNAIPAHVDSDILGSFRVLDKFMDIGAFELSGAECKSAIRLSCGDTLQATARHQGLSPIENLPDCLYSSNSNYYRSTWFTFIGTGDSVKLTLSDYESSSMHVEMHLLRGDCGTYNCETAITLEEPNDGEITFPTEIDSQYHLYIAVWEIGPNDLDDFTLSMICFCDDRELSYSSPQDFIRGDLQKIETDLTIEADNTIGKEADIIYDAGQGIDLKMGFEVKAGATFLALPEGCGGS